MIQGSRTVPLLFDVYSNDFNAIVNDDAGLVFSSDSHENLVVSTNGKLELVFQWCNFNKLPLNHRKCEHMVLGNAEKQSAQ